MLEEWLAGVLDFNGSISIRLGKVQLQPYVAIYSRKRNYLEWLREMYPNFSRPANISKNLFMIQIVSIRGTYDLLSSVLPHLNILREIARKVVRFCEMRLNHINTTYDLAELQLVQEIVKLTSRPSSLPQRLAVIEQWL